MKHEFKLGDRVIIERPFGKPMIEHEFVSIKGAMGTIIDHPVDSGGYSTCRVAMDDSKFNLTYDKTCYLAYLHELELVDDIEEPFVRESIEKLEAVNMSNVTDPRLFTNKASKAQAVIAERMVYEIKELIYTNEDKIPLALALGVLRIVERELMDEHS